MRKRRRVAASEIGRTSGAKLAFLVALASGLSAILIYITGVSDLDGPFRLSSEDLEALKSLQIHFQKFSTDEQLSIIHRNMRAVSSLAWLLQMEMTGPLVVVSANGLGLQAVHGRDNCEVSLKFPEDTIPKWKDPKTGELEGLSFDFNLCEAVATWEQVRNSTTILTREFIDSLPNGWEEYAWKRINKGVLLNGCENRTLCMEKLSLVLPDRPPYTPRQFGRCAVIGNSGDLLKTKFGKEIDSYDAVVRENGAPIQNFTEYVGTKSTFRLLNRGSAKALDKVAELYDKGKEEVPILNHVYLMLGASFGSAAKGTGLKALEFALSMCDTVDMYGFTVDPGYKEWRVGAGSSDPLAACSIIAKQLKGKFGLPSGSRKAAVEHHKYVRGATMYPLEHSPGHGLLCTVPST
ncbi:hypothetical protein DH2020_038487 [Rehmannia glutinosa]|uniref:Sialyltransferase-like protein n=1 Tax=Rehmannia glutinosa TaxID=99300 RepID=A0ABR0UYF2_REHGL